MKDPIGITGWPKEKGRDGERTPMQWDETENAGFTRGTPWLPVPPSATAINVSVEKSDPELAACWYKALIRLKKTVPAFENGANIMLDTENTKVLSWMRQAHGAPQLVVSVNFTAEPETVDLAIGRSRDQAAKTEDPAEDSGGTDAVALDRIVLGPYGVYIGEMQ